MTALSIGSSASIVVGDGGAVVIATNGGIATVSVTPVVGASETFTVGPEPARRTFGPYSEGASLHLSNVNVGQMDYEGTAAGGAGLTAAQSAAGATSVVAHTAAGALVGADGQALGAAESATGPAVALTAAATGKRQAVGAARALSMTCAAGGTIYYRFTDASGVVAVSTADATAALGTTALRIPVTAGLPYIEYLRLGGADVSFVVQPLV